MLAFLFNLDLMEIAIIAGGAVIVFGKELPQVVMRGVAQFMRMRNAVTRMWREAGLEDELRKVRWELERDARVKSTTQYPAVAAPAAAAKSVTTLVDEDEELEDDHGFDPEPDPALSESSEDEPGDGDREAS